MIKKYDLNPEKTGIIYHTYTETVNFIDDYKKYVKNVINEKGCHYYIIQNPQGGFNIYNSLDLNEDTNFFFPNFENIKAIKDYCRINNYAYNQENTDKYKNMVLDSIPLFSQRGFDLIDYNDYNHFFLHVNIIADMDNLDKKTYNKIANALVEIMDTYNLDNFEEYKYKYTIGGGNFDHQLFAEIMEKKLFM